MHGGPIAAALPRHASISTIASARARKPWCRARDCAIVRMPVYMSIVGARKRDIFREFGLIRQNTINVFMLASRMEAGDLRHA